MLQDYNVNLWIIIVRENGKLVKEKSEKSQGNYKNEILRPPSEISEKVIWNT